jgi:hypothetical protein
VYGRSVAAIATFASLALAGCAGTRLASGTFHSSKGYRVSVPGAEWTPMLRGPADLELRHQPEPAGIVVNASCEDVSPQTSLEVLTRHLLLGLNPRTVVLREDVTVDGRPAQHSVLAGRARDADEPVKVEAYVVRDGRCVYDFLYAAPEGSFGVWQADFRQVVGTFARE